eukprot:SAG11_NODE_3190_length_2623_cov_2.275357_4_plen_79_part_00
MISCTFARFYQSSHVLLAGFRSAVLSPQVRPNADYRADVEACYIKGFDKTITTPGGITRPMKITCRCVHHMSRSERMG